MRQRDGAEVVTGDERHVRGLLGVCAPTRRVAGLAEVVGELPDQPWPNALQQGGGTPVGRPAVGRSCSVIDRLPGERVPEGNPARSSSSIDETSSTVAATGSALQRHLVRPLGEMRPQRACQCRQFEVRQVGAAAHGLPYRVDDRAQSQRLAERRAGRTRTPPHWTAFTAARACEAPRRFTRRDGGIGQEVADTPRKRWESQSGSDTLLAHK
jgi:hypothetical protein